MIHSDELVYQQNIQYNELS